MTSEKFGKRENGEEFTSPSLLVIAEMSKVTRQIECRGDMNRLNASLIATCGSLAPTAEETETQKQLLALLEKHVRKEWPTACVYLFGSAATSFGLRNSDMDMCILMDGRYYNQKYVDKSMVLLKLAGILQSNNFQNVKAVTNARVPIVKCMAPTTRISCDISVNNVMAIINTGLLRDYALIDSRLQLLVFIVKQWAKSRGINNTYGGTLSSYAYVLMCIHFLQQRTPAILPCLQGMTSTFKVNVDNIECAYFDQVEKLLGFGSRNKESIAQLFWEFFNYWAYFHNYADDVVSVRTGHTLSKRQKNWTRVSKFDRHLLCIEDPFYISKDVGRSVDESGITVLRNEFRRAAQIMQYDPNPCVTLFKS